jgi:hypothetical protein
MVNGARNFDSLVFDCPNYPGTGGFVFRQPAIVFLISKNAEKPSSFRDFLIFCSEKHPFAQMSKLILNRRLHR